MGNFSSFESQKRRLSSASPSSFARPVHPLMPVPAPSLHPDLSERKPQFEHAHSFEHSLDRMSMLPSEPHPPVRSKEGQQTDHTVQQKRSAQDSPQGSMESIPPESAQTEKRPRLGWNFADISLFPDLATLPNATLGSPASMGQRLPTRRVGPYPEGYPTPLSAWHLYTTQVMQRRERDETREQNVPPKKNITGLPEMLKAGVEHLSGLSLDDVRVHYNSSQPAEMQALAYTQGTDIYVGQGQEQHLAHEAWHVVQQKQGRVKPTLQLQKKQIDEDAHLESEAEIIGKAALHNNKAVKRTKREEQRSIVLNNSAYPPIQRYKITEIYKDGLQHIVFDEKEVQPDEKGDLGRDGYSYEQVGNFEYIRTKKDTKINYDMLDNPAYDDISSILDKNPFMSVREFEVAAWQRTIHAQYEGMEQPEQPVEVTDEQRESVIEYLIGTRYVPVIRFAAKADLRSKAPIPPAWKDFFDEPTKKLEKEIYVAAFKHMNNKEKDMSPLISVSRDEGALLGTSDYISAQSIVFGSPELKKQAPLIVHLLIPRSIMITPEKMEPYINEQTGDIGSLTLQKKEQEAVLLAEDLSTYIVAVRPNPYTPQMIEKFVGNK